LFSAFARVKTDRAQTSAFESQIEVTNTVFNKMLSSSDGSRAVIGLHANRTKSVGAPICFKKSGLVAIVASKTRARGHTELDFVEEEVQSRCPGIDRDGLAMA
jgi:hypothetical protein